MLNQLKGVRGRNKAMKKQLEGIAKKVEREAEKAARLREKLKEMEANRSLKAELREVR
ncbi:hypothetical protein IH992_03780 [Candidatus Poribacteria bacterium]|nr:hypothetical protein [Candidatus Poribacteria bacterium]